MLRSKGNLLIEAISDRSQVLCLSTLALSGQECNQAEASSHSTTIRLQPVEVGLVIRTSIPGSQTQQMKTLAESYSKNSLTLVLEAPAGSIQEAFLRFNQSEKLNLQVTGANIQGNILRKILPWMFAPVTCKFSFSD